MTGFGFVLRGVFLFLMVCLMGPGSSYAEGNPQTTQDLGMSGTIGKEPIAMIITLENRTHPTKAHYSSASAQKIIPLTVQVTGNHVVLSGQDKEVFTLHFVSGSREKADPLSFYAASGMQGMWSDGTKTLPVSLRFVLSRDHLADCIFYPHHLPDDKPVPAEKRCEQDADMAALRQCVQSPYTSDDAVESCINAALKTCHPDQRTTNLCVSDITVYLDRAIRQRLASRTPHGLTEQSYPLWLKHVTQSCLDTSGFSPEGTGFAADIGFCVAEEKLRLLQNALQPMPQRIRSERPRH